MKLKQRPRVNYSSIYVKVSKIHLTLRNNTIFVCLIVYDIFSFHPFPVRRKTNVRYFYNSDLNLVYLTGSDDDGYVECFYLASSSSATLDLTATETIQAKLMETHAHECKDIGNVLLMLAIIDPNSTIVYYKLSLGLISLESLRDERSSSFQHRTREHFQQNLTS